MLSASATSRPARQSRSTSNSPTWALTSGRGRPELAHEAQERDLELAARGDRFPGIEDRRTATRAGAMLDARQDGRDVEHLQRLGALERALEVARPSTAARSASVRETVVTGTPACTRDLVGASRAVPWRSIPARRDAAAPRRR